MITTEHFETIVIGAGQAGLSTGYHLARQGREFLILDAHEPVGDVVSGSTLCGCTARQSTTDCPDWAYPRRAGPGRARTTWPTTSRRMQPASTFRSAPA